MEHRRSIGRKRKALTPEPTGWGVPEHLTRWDVPEWVEPEPLSEWDAPEWVEPEPLSEWDAMRPE
jgi:hypothetical protein